MCVQPEGPLRDVERDMLATAESVDGRMLMFSYRSIPLP